MRVLRGIHYRVARPTCLALGVFDGVHRGHRRVIGATVRQSGPLGATPAVLTFDPHPAAIVGSGKAPPLLTTTDEKIETIRELGVGLVVVAAFDRALASMPAERFVSEVLVRRLRARCVVVGSGWRFGAGGKGDPSLLRRIAADYGFGVTTVPAVLAGRSPVSSTRIRKLLLEGGAEEAARLLGRRYSIVGPVVPGDGLGRQLGFPTANLHLPPEKLLPADGVYACWASGLGRGTGSSPPAPRLWPALCYIGTRPTVAASGVRRAEVHLLRRRGPLGAPGSVLRAELISRLRPDRRFPSTRALVAQMALDRLRACQLLGLQES
ncbi:MAG: bifunctional riboflavin kinase/FAD synthetase [Armatimonadota bacterium]